MKSFWRAPIHTVDRILRQRDLERSLQAVEADLNHFPWRLDLLERQAEICEQLDDSERLVSAYRELGRGYVREGLHPRAIAVYKQILEVDPQQEGIHAELAAAIGEARREQKAGRRPSSSSEEEPTAPLPGPTATTLPSATPPPATSRPPAASTLFTLFDTEALEELLASTCLRYFQAGEVIFNEGELGSSLFILVEGQVDILTLGRAGELVHVEELGPGELFGEVTVISNAPHLVTVRAKSPAVAVEVSRQRIEIIAQEHPQVPKVLRRFCEAHAQRTLEVLMRASSRQRRPRLPQTGHR